MKWRVVAQGCSAWKREMWQQRWVPKGDLRGTSGTFPGEASTTAFKKVQRKFVSPMKLVFSLSVNTEHAIHLLGLYWSPRENILFFHQDPIGSGKSHSKNHLFLQKAWGCLSLLLSVLIHPFYWAVSTHILPVRTAQRHTIKLIHYPFLLIIFQLLQLLIPLKVDISSS